MQTKGAAVNGSLERTRIFAGNARPPGAGGKTAPRNDARIIAQSTGPAPQRAAGRFPYRRACQQALFYYNVPTI